MSTYLLKKHDKGKHQPIQQCDIGRVAPNFVSRPNAQSIIFEAYNINRYEQNFTSN